MCNGEKKICFAHNKNSGHLLLLIAMVQLDGVVGSDDKSLGFWADGWVVGSVILLNENRRPNMSVPVSVGMFAVTALHTEVRRSFVMFLSTDRQILKQ